MNGLASSFREAVTKGGEKVMIVRQEAGAKVHFLWDQGLMVALGCFGKYPPEVRI